MPEDTELREAARARGFRLAKSRRRKPGGDFGRYGLTDASGRECLGFGPEGLTATGEEVLAYLRGGEAASWRRSLIGLVEDAAAPRPAKKRKPAGPAAARTPKEPPAQIPPESKPEADTRSPARPVKIQGRGRQRLRPSGGSAPSTSLWASPEVDRDPEPARPPLTIRAATRRDAAALAKLLGIPSAALAERLAAAARADESPLFAERDGIVGVAAYTIVQTLQDGPRGRVTLLHVADPERRQGIGAKLLAEAERRLAESGVAQAELLLDIDFDAPTGFLRRTGWERRTNGYAKPLSD